MPNKKRVFNIAALLLLLCIISTVIISGTFADYSSVYSGHDKAIIATWNIVAQGGQDSLAALTPGGSYEAKLDLFSHGNYSNMNNEFKNIIAPGVEGSFTLNVTNLSDIEATIKFEFSEPEADFKDLLEFSIEEDELTGLNVTGLNDALKNITLPQEDGNFVTTIKWKWPSGENDTQFGKDSYENLQEGSRSEYVLNVKVTATQATPTPAPPLED